MISIAGFVLEIWIDVEKLLALTPKCSWKLAREHMLPWKSSSSIDECIGHSVDVTNQGARKAMPLQVTLCLRWSIGFQLKTALGSKHVSIDIVSAPELSRSFEYHGSEHEDRGLRFGRSVPSCVSAWKIITIAVVSRRDLFLCGSPRCYRRSSETKLRGRGMWCRPSRIPLILHYWFSTAQVIHLDGDY
ncbi:hypothetical protein IQ06DRAFT_122158 [Phaeosphaeriaceae sp. SRC1lsM3a]|nr:hypothetical protein IQ06DRAFT_122158 [Stagonospora sp. SRC1lsM3a]